MRCAWQAYLNLLPARLRQPLDKLGRDNLQELRLRIGQPPELVLKNGRECLDFITGTDDLQYVISSATRYSPWSAESAAKGFITASGGHRIGICGEAVVHDGAMRGFRYPTSLCIRVSRDFDGIAAAAEKYNGSVIIVGKPGSGKTTLLRDLIRLRSKCVASSISVVDERMEIFPAYQGTNCFPCGPRTDVLVGCRKSQGIEAVLRNMGPDTIAVDEITSQEDCEALLHAGWCGVNLLATAHAGNLDDLLTRPVYRPLIDKKLFDTVLILHADKSWHAERLK